MKVIVGIDPGLTGGIAFISTDGTGIAVASQRTPILSVGGKRDYDIPGMRRTLCDHPYEIKMVCIERVHTLPRDGRVGAFRFGTGYGIWLGMIGALQLPSMEVTPQRWQATMLAGLPRGPKTKVSAVRASTSLFPTLPLKVKADWGIADAALLAEYARRKLIGAK